MKPRRTASVVLALAGCASLLAQVPSADNIPNWSVPPTWSPAVEYGGIQTMTDVTSPRLFVGIAPCRIADTRTGQGFSGQAGPPILSANVTRNFQISGSPGTLPAPPNGCPANAIPFSAEAVSFQFTVVSPTDAGNLIAWPEFAVQPQVSVLNWPAGTSALGNGTIVAVNSAFGSLSVRLNMAPGQSAHLVIDVNGYFASRPQNQANFLELIVNSASSPTAHFKNESAACDGICGLHAEVANGVAIYATTNGNTPGIRGTGGISGVEGEAGFAANYAGVRGTSGASFTTNFCCGPAGVRGQSAHVGVVGLGKDIGVAGRIYNADGNAVAAGDLAVPTGPNATFGVRGTSLTSGVGSAGVKGSDYSGEPTDVGTCCDIAGVRGVSRLNHGVQGVSRDVAAVVGFNLDGAGSILALGALGVNDALGVYFQNGLAGTGTKSFVEPHPTDASKAIRYVSLEGNEAGTYFRGRGKFERGLARIAVPEDFRLVTDPEGLTVQITPIGEMASYAVVRVGLDEIVVKSSRNIEFFYTVNGQRQAYRDWNPIVTSEDFFMPASADGKLPKYFNEEERRRLVANGTYREDGTVNLETAERVGWTRVWAERVEKQRAAAARARAESSLELLAEP